MVMDAREPRVSRPTARRGDHGVAFGASLISRVHSPLHPMLVKSVGGDTGLELTAHHYRVSIPFKREGVSER